MGKMKILWNGEASWPQGEDNRPSRYWKVCTQTPRDPTHGWVWHQDDGPWEMSLKERKWGSPTAKCRPREGMFSAPWLQGLWGHRHTSPSSNSWWLPTVTPCGQQAQHQRFLKTRVLPGLCFGTTENPQRFLSNSRGEREAQAGYKWSTWGLRLALFSVVKPTLRDTRSWRNGQYWFCPKRCCSISQAIRAPNRPCLVSSFPPAPHSALPHPLSPPHGIPLSGSACLQRTAL